MKQFIVLKTISNFGTSVTREFDNLDDAKKFTTLLRESEEHEFITYTIAQVVNF